MGLIKTTTTDPTKRTKQEKRDPTRSTYIFKVLVVDNGIDAEDALEDDFHLFSEVFREGCA